MYPHGQRAGYGQCKSRLNCNKPSCSQGGFRSDGEWKSTTFLIFKLCFFLYHYCSPHSRHSSNYGLSSFVHLCAVPLKMVWVYAFSSFYYLNMLKTQGKNVRFLQRSSNYITSVMLELYKIKTSPKMVY